MTMTLDVNVLMKRWMVIYMNLNVLKSSDPIVTEILDEIKEKLAECNELVMRFFDMVDADPMKA